MTTIRQTVAVQIGEDADDPSLLPNVERAVGDLVRSLELPVEPAFELASVQKLPGEVRIVVGDRAVRLRRRDRGALFTGLEGIWRVAGEFVTEEVARLSWRQWTGEEGQRLDGRRLADLRWVLANGARIGMRLSRFSEVAHRLAQEPPSAAERWELFEDAIGGTDCCVRVSVGENVWSLRAMPEQGGGVLRDFLFDNHGLVLQSFTSSEEVELALGELRVEWNDLRLPSIRVPEMEAVGQVVSTIGALLLGSDGALVNRHVMDFHLLKLQETEPVLATTLQQRFSPAVLTAVARTLVADRLSLRQMVRIATAMLTVEETVTAELSRYIVFSPLGVSCPGSQVPASEVDRLVAASRIELKGFITRKAISEEGELPAFLMAPKWETRVASGIPLSAAERAELISAVANQRSPDGTFAWPILVRQDARIALREELRSEFPDLAILTYSELDPSCSIRPVARIGQAR